MFRARPPRRDWRGGLEAIALSVGLGVAVLFALVVGNNVPWLAVLSEHRWAVVAGAAVVGGGFASVAARAGVHPLVTVGSPTPTVLAPFIAYGGFGGLTPAYLLPVMVLDEALPVAVSVGILATLLGRRLRRVRSEADG